MSRRWILRGRCTMSRLSMHEPSMYENEKDSFRGGRALLGVFSSRWNSC